MGFPTHLGRCFCPCTPLDESPFCCFQSSEKGVFTPSAVNRLAWLAGVQAVAIELHDRFVPGCTEAVTSALADDFEIDASFNSEYVLAVRKKA